MIESVLTAEKKFPVRHTYAGTKAECSWLETISSMRIIFKTPQFRIVTAYSPVGTQPYLALRIGPYLPNNCVRQPPILRSGDEFFTSGRHETKTVAIITPPNI